MVDLDNLQDESTETLLEEKESLVDFISTETARGGSARTEYRQLDAVRQELENRSEPP
jgi:hypothetical protein